MRLALDHHYSPDIAVALRSRGHDVVAAIERGWDHLDDEELLSACAAEERALLTNDVRDFVLVARTWSAEGRPHGGLIFTSDSSMPRRRTAIGAYVDGLEALLTADDGLCAFVDRVHWL